DDVGLAVLLEELALAALRGLEGRGAARLELRRALVRVAHDALVARLELGVHGRRALRELVELLRELRRRHVLRLRRHRDAGDVDVARAGERRGGHRAERTRRLLWRRTALALRRLRAWRRGGQRLRRARRRHARLGALHRSAGRLL